MGVVQVSVQKERKQPKRPKGLKPCALFDGDVWPDHMPTLALGQVWHQDCWEAYQNASDKRDLMHHRRKKAEKRAERDKVFKENRKGEW